MSAYVQIASLTKFFGASRALEDIQLQVERGSVLALLGPNGAGKSTLFGCLLGLTFPTRGDIRLNGRPVTESNRADFGYVAERVSLYPQRTVEENAAFFVRLKGQPAAQVTHQLERVGLSHVRDRKVRHLSKGMLQRLGLAIALCGRPQLLVLDEPFNGLDPAVLDDLRSILRDENERGATLLISTHTMSAVEPIASHVAILLEGRLAASGTLEELRARHGRGESLETIYHRVACRRKATEEVLT